MTEKTQFVSSREGVRPTWRLFWKKNETESEAETRLSSEPYLWGLNIPKHSFTGKNGGEFHAGPVDSCPECAKKQLETESQPKEAGKEEKPKPKPRGRPKKAKS